MAHISAPLQTSARPEDDLVSYSFRGAKAVQFHDILYIFFCGVRHPQTQGKVERFHGALELARRRRGLPEAALQKSWLDDFREEYNHLRPHEALAMKTPASCWHPSPRLFQNDPPEWVYPDTGELLQHLQIHFRNGVERGETCRVPGC